MGLVQWDTWAAEGVIVTGGNSLKIPPVGCWVDLIVIYS